MKLIKDTKSYGSAGDLSVTKIKGLKEILLMVTFIGTIFIKQNKGSDLDETIKDASWFTAHVRKKFGNE